MSAGDEGLQFSSRSAFGPLNAYRYPTTSFFFCLHRRRRRASTYFICRFMHAYITSCFALRVVWLHAMFFRREGAVLVNDPWVPFKIPCSCRPAYAVHLAGRRRRETTGCSGSACVAGPATRMAWLSSALRALNLFSCLCTHVPVLWMSVDQFHAVQLFRRWLT